MGTGNGEKRRYCDADDGEDNGNGSNKVIVRDIVMIVRMVSVRQLNSMMTMVMVMEGQG